MVTNRVGNAIDCFQSGYNCSQAVAMDFAADSKILPDIVLQAAAGFGGGYGHNDGPCGAVSGGILVIGLLLRSSHPEGEMKKQLYHLTRQYIEQIQDRLPSLQCTDLCGYNISNDEELQKARNVNVFREKCDLYVVTYVEILENLAIHHHLIQ